MTRARTVLALALTLAALTAWSGVAGAAGSADDRISLTTGEVPAETEELGGVAETVDETTAGEDAPGALERIGEALGAAAGAVADAAVAVAGALADGAAAVGSALAWTGSALWAGITATGAAIAWTGAQIGHGIAFLGKGIWSGTVWVALGIADLFLAAGDALVWTGAALGSALAAAGGLVATGAVSAWNGLGSLLGGLVAAWPQDPKHQAIVASSAAGAAAAGGAAWYTRAWRYLGAVPFLAPLYARIGREELLDHPVRQRLYDLIRGQPGIHVSELGRELEVSWGTLLHHLDKLERAQLVLSRDTSGKRCFFLPGQVGRDQQTILPALENETALSIAEYFAGHAGATQGEAADALDLSAALVSWHVKRLEKAGVLTRTREGRTKRVGITGEAQEAMAALA